MPTDVNVHERLTDGDVCRARTGAGDGGRLSMLAHRPDVRPVWLFVVPVGVACHAGRRRLAGGPVWAAAGRLTTPLAPAVRWHARCRQTGPRRPLCRACVVVSGLGSCFAVKEPQTDMKRDAMTTGTTRPRELTTRHSVARAAGVSASVPANHAAHGCRSRVRRPSQRRMRGSVRDDLPLDDASGRPIGV